MHIPFCFHKCHYCDFYSITRQSPQRMCQFVDRLLREAEMWSAGRGAAHLRAQTVFFGGGTPSLLPMDSMERLIRGLRDRLNLSNVTEWTVECNPATVSPEYCRMLRNMGVDRLSFGAQSFERSDLVLLERHHEPDDVPRSIEIARSAGFARLNVDLIYGIPHQDIASWQTSLERAIALHTSHLSCYGLTYEPNTPLAVRKRMGMVQPVEESVELEMVRHARQRLIEAGLSPYEISNYARPGEECRHNLTYWTGGDYAGLGPSAASHVEGHRFRNRAHLGEWERSIDDDQLPVIEYEILNARRRASELVMLMLRLSGGLSFSDYSARTGFDAREIFFEPIDRLTRAGLLNRDSAGIRLTGRGLELADWIACEFLGAD